MLSTWLLDPHFTTQDEMWQQGTALITPQGVINTGQVDEGDGYTSHVSLNPSCLKGVTQEERQEYFR